MFPIEIEDRTYVLEFRHKTTKVKRRNKQVLPPELSPKGSVRAITTCVLIALKDDPESNIQFVGIENAVCSKDDPFSRRMGRQRAFDKLLRTCGALKDVKAQLAFKFADLKLGVELDDKGNPVKPPAKQKVKPTQEQITRWRADAEDRGTVALKRRFPHCGVLIEIHWREG